MDLMRIFIGTSIASGLSAPVACRKLCQSLVRLEETDRGHLALDHLAGASIAWRKVGIVYGKSLGLAEVKARLDRQETALSKEGMLIKAYVMNTALC